jgi:hypothetical protein
MAACSAGGPGPNTETAHANLGYRRGNSAPQRRRVRAKHDPASVEAITQQDRWAEPGRRDIEFRQRSHAAPQPSAIRPPIGYT